MRKLSVLLTITILSTLFLFISAFSKWEVHSILFQDEAIHIDYSSNDSGNDFATLIKELNEFSVTHDLNITQNNFVSQKKVNIYSTNFNDDRDYKMLRGSQPEKNKYVSNRAESNDVTSGYLIFPVTLLDVRVFEFDQVNNVGISNTFYVDTLSIKAKEDFVEIFSKYGKVTFESTTESKTVFFEPLALIIFIMCYVILVIGLVFQLFHERKHLMLMVVWGYSQTRLTMQCLKHMMPSWIAPILIAHFGLGFYVIYFNQLGYFTELYFILLLSILLILISVVIASSLIIRKLVSYSITEAIQGKIRFKNMVKLFLFIKTVTIIVFVLMLSRTFTQVDELNKVKKGMAYWDNTQNIYTTIVGGRFDETLKDLKKDRKYNDRVLGFYHDLKKKKHGFIMVSDNFGRVNNEDGTWTYFYELDTQGDEEIYSPNGRRVTIDDNYLKVNEIVKANGEKISSEDFIIEDDVLNILVPYKQKLHEKDIIRAYKEWFYFYKVEVDNIYNEALKLPLNRKSIDELDINVVYVEDNQKYFTYNIFSGDEKNYVIDPIAVIYNDSMDTSCIGSIATRALFYEASDNISAYGEILPLIQKHNSYEIIGAYSVYSDMNGYLFKLIERIYFNLICAVVAAIVLSAVSAFYLWFYYQNNSKKIYILHLHGYSFWEAHKQVLTSICMTNFIAILVLVIITRSTLIIFYGLMTIFFIESIVVGVVVKKLDNNNSKQIIEGGRL